MSRRNQDRIDFHRNYSDHGRPSPTGSDDSYNAFPTFDTPAPSFDTGPNDFPNAYRSTQRPTADSLYPYYPPAQQQETQSFHTTHYSYQRRSEAGGQTHSTSHNRASRSSSSADPRQSPTLDDPEGRRQGQSYYQSQDPTLRSSHSAQHPHASYISPYPPAANPAYPAGHRSYRGDDSTVEATNTHYERPLATSRASLDSTNWNSQGNTQLTYVRDPSTLSPVPIPYGVPPVTSGPSINNRERTEVGQIKAPDTVDDCTSSSATEEASEERSELGYGVRLKLGGLELWYQNKRQSSHSGKRDSAKSESSSGGK